MKPSVRARILFWVVFLIPTAYCAFTIGEISATQYEGGNLAHPVQVRIYKEATDTTSVEIAIPETEGENPFVGLITENSLFVAPGMVHLAKWNVNDARWEETVYAVPQPMPFGVQSVWFWLLWMALSVLAGGYFIERSKRKTLQDRES